MPFLSGFKGRFRGYSASSYLPNTTSYPTASRDNDAPPRYSSMPPEDKPPAAGAAVSTDNDPYAFLTQFDTVFVIDDSLSMSGSSWREVSNVLQCITGVCAEHDEDGIDVYFLNHQSTSTSPPAGKAPFGYYNISNAQVVEALFAGTRPRGATFIGTRLREILKAYMKRLGPDSKPVNIIVITDGQPSDDPESTIIQYAKKLDKLDAPLHQVGIQFFQVGRDAAARRALKELDDGLAEMHIRDMVDTCTFDAVATNGVKCLTAERILKVVLGAVVRRFDRKEG